MSWLTRLFSRRLRAALSARPAAKRLSVEELEPRWVPSTVNATTSANWSGYAVTANTGAVTGVSGQWTVPTVTGSGAGTTYSSAWVGIDGYNSATVEQTGTEMDVTNGKASYSAWYEMFPNAMVPITSIKVKPGDTISASVSYNATPGNFTLKLTDSDGNQSFTTTQSIAKPHLSSAEWIVEAPSSGSVLPLANFGSVTFANAQATINGATGPITNSATVNKINMVNRAGTVEAATSSLTTSGLGFSVAFGSGTPISPPPVSPPPVSPPPTTSVATVTSLTATVNPRSRVPSVTFVATVTAASGLPAGKVEIMDGNTILGTAQVQDVNGVMEVVFTVTFPEPGMYHISVVYPGSGSFSGSTSNTITVTVT